ncbi:MAG: GNAT family N-acetyltransferase [Dehalococcoidia bacterium]|nr:GNAT family N-acetyltransferase [Dehalococcoidia bacterium]
MEPQTQERPAAPPRVREVDQPVPFTLRDGRTMLLRRIRPDDAEDLVEGFRMLSPRSVRMRFFSPMRELDPRFARRLADVDFVSRAAFVATFPDDDQVRAVGRYESDSPGVAEVAFVTLDELQGQGIASAMLERLVDLARSNGIRTFVAYVLPENAAMLNLFRRCGLPRRIRRDGELIRVELDLS